MVRKDLNPLNYTRKKSSKRIFVRLNWRYFGYALYPSVGYNRQPAWKLQWGIPVSEEEQKGMFQLLDLSCLLSPILPSQGVIT